MQKLPSLALKLKKSRYWDNDNIRIIIGYVDAGSGGRHMVVSTGPFPRNIQLEQRYTSSIVTHPAFDDQIEQLQD